MSILTISNEHTVYTEVATVTMSITRLRSYVVQVISIVVFVATRSQAMVSYRIVVAPTSEEPGMSSGMLIGVVSGGGVAAAVVAGLVMFMIRTRRKSGSGSSDAPESSMTFVASADQSLDDDVVLEVQPEEPAGMAVYEMNEDFPDDETGPEQDAVIYI
jgi:hypothetical protein